MTGRIVPTWAIALAIAIGAAYGLGAGAYSDRHPQVITTPTTRTAVEHPR